MDVHEVGPGKVNPDDLAGAHRKDLEVQDKHGVELKAYWFDQKNGRIYCLDEAPSAEALIATHKDAHGLLANKTMSVVTDGLNWTPAPGTKLFSDVHQLGAGKVTKDAVAEAHKKDLAAEGKHGVKFLNYWLDEANGTVIYLSQAPRANASIAVHKEAHGLLPDSIEEVSEGR